MVEAAAYVKDGEWKTWTPTQMAGIDVHGATLGVIGFGAIGQAIARRAQGFGMRVLCWNRIAAHSPRQASAVGAQNSATVRRGPVAAQTLSAVSVALTDDTRGLDGCGERLRR